jgi:hypothetical protein
MKIPSFFVIDLSKPTDYRIRDPTCFPVNPISDCEECRARKSYRTITQASDHLRKHHFLGQSVSVGELARWIATPQQLWNYQLCADADELLAKLLDHCTHLCTLKKEICYGVSNGGNFDSTVYRVPRGLVKVFQRILMLVVYVSHMGSTALKACATHSYDASPLTFIDSEHNVHLTQLGLGAEGAFDDAKNDLMLMSRTEDYSRSMSSEAVGPEYVLALLLSHLHTKTSAEDALNLVQRYGGFAARLVSVCTNQPR